jgi:predicted nuclease of predicted toxin-antitoxin system
MIILADENIEHMLIDKLAINFHVISIYKSHRGASDYEVAEIAKQTGAIILTEDNDFGDMVYIQGDIRLSVILLRYSYHEREAIYDVLIQLLNNNSSQLTGKFTTVTTKKIRTREL